MVPFCSQGQGGWAWGWAEPVISLDMNSWAVNLSTDKSSYRILVCFFWYTLLSHYSPWCCTTSDPCYRRPISTLYTPCRSPHCGWKGRCSHCPCQDLVIYRVSHKKSYLLATALLNKVQFFVGYPVFLFNIYSQSKSIKLRFFEVITGHQSIQFLLCPIDTRYRRHAVRSRGGSRE